MTLISYFFIIFLFFSYTNAIETRLNGLELLCVSYNLTELKNPPVKLTFMLSCSGENEKEIEIMVKNSHNMPLWHESGVSHILKDLNVTEKGLYHFCVKNLDNKEKKITFYITNDEIVKDSNIEMQSLDSLQALLGQIINGIKKIFTGQEILNEVSNNHMNLLMDKLNLLKNCLFIKMSILMMIGVIQYLIINAMFKKGKTVENA